MGDASHNELLTEFCSITGADEERGRFYLEASGWQLQVALSSFFDGGDDESAMTDPVDIEPLDPSPPTEQKKKTTKQAGGSSSRFATMSSMQQDPESSGDEEKGQAFYAGGSEHSGQQVLGPPRKKKQSSDNLIENMLKSAREHGAEEVSAGASSNQPKQPVVFRGTGYKLGETEGAAAPSDVVQGAPLEEQAREIQVVLKLWKQGFSVDDGPLRDYGDDKNKEFLDSIHRGQVPLELLRQARGGEVDLQMEDHRGEDFVPPKVKPKAFTGAGHMLGSPAPTVVDAPSAADSEKNESAAKNSVSINESLPTTNIQIRLGDGSRLVAKFNHSHQVSDIRNYILRARPQYSGSSFILMTTFPNKEITDESISLEAAKLLNAVIVQRMK